MLRSRIAVPLLAATFVLGIARANAEDPPADVDTARASERHAIEPGGEALIGTMLGKEQDLPGGCKLTDGKIERTAVLATYGCAGTDVVLQLRHPDDASAGSVRTERFAVDVKSGTPPAGLVEAVAAKIRAGEAGFHWTDVGNGRAAHANGITRWLVVLALGVAAFLVYRLRRRRAPSPSTD